MIKIIGATLLSVGCVLFGALAAQRLRSCVYQLGQLITGLKIVGKEMEYRLAPLPELLYIAGERTEGSAAVFFQKCAQGAEHLEGRAFQTIWKEALAESEFHFESDIRVIMEHLGCVLGRYDVESQLQTLQESIGKLGEMKQIAEERCKRLGKVYGVLGLTGGAFVLILMI